MPDQVAKPLDDALHPHRCVYVIDDDSGIRKSLHFLLASVSIIAWPFAEAIDFLDQLPGLVPAPILLDLRMPRIDALQMLQILKDRGIAWPVIIMTAHGDVTAAVSAMKLGAIEFLEKPFKPAVLDRALEQAFGALAQMQRVLGARDEARQRVGRLSPRESKVMAILMHGTLNKIAAHQLGLSVRTVEMHRTHAFAKLEVKSMAEVVTLVAAADLGGGLGLPNASGV